MPITGQTLKTLVRIGDTPDDCWIWIGNKNKKTGYGKKTFSGKTILAHRWVYQLFVGPIPEGLVVNHKCSNPGCVNPFHLEVVDQSGNVREGKGCSLTPDQAKAIKDQKTNKQWGSGARLAKEYNVSPALIHDIWNGRAWRNI